MSLRAHFCPKACSGEKSEVPWTFLCPADVLGAYLFMVAQSSTQLMWLEVVASAMGSTLGEEFWFGTSCGRASAAALYF